MKLLAVRDNLRHASIATISPYLHGEDAERARQLDGAFGTDLGRSNNFCCAGVNAAALARFSAGFLC